MPTAREYQEFANYPAPPQTISAESHVIVIWEALNGFQVKVGCKNLVFETREKMLSELERYLKNRAAVEKEYLEKYK